MVTHINCFTLVGANIRPAETTRMYIAPLTFDLTLRTVTAQYSELKEDGLMVGEYMEQYIGHPNQVGWLG